MRLYREYARWPHAADHMLVKGGGVLVLSNNLLVEDFG